MEQRIEYIEPCEICKAERAKAYVSDFADWLKQHGLTPREGVTIAEMTRNFLECKPLDVDFKTFILGIGKDNLK